jgi:hypothetical protein
VLHHAPDHHEDLERHHNYFKVKAANEIKVTNGLGIRTFDFRVKYFIIVLENEP